MRAFQDPNHVTTAVKPIFFSSLPFTSSHLRNPMNSYILSIADGTAGLVLRRASISSEKNNEVERRRTLY